MRKSKIIGTYKYKAEISGQYNHEGDEKFVVNLPKKYRFSSNSIWILYSYYYQIYYWK